MKVADVYTTFTMLDDKLQCRPLSRHSEILWHFPDNVWH